MTTLAPLPEVEQITERVTRVLCGNPGPFTLQGTNCYLVGTGNRKFLVDTGVVDNEQLLTNLKRTLEETNTQIEAILITHWHRDHAGGIEGVVKETGKGREIPVCKFPQVKATDQPLGDGLKYTYVEYGHVFATEGATLRALYTPGHADDHMCLWLEEEQAAFTGDTVLGEGTCVFEDLSDYMKSLEKIHSLQSSRLYPAHGSVVPNPHQHLSMYINHRRQREQQVLAALSGASKPLTIREVVDVVYENLADNLMKGAMNNVRRHLEKLLKEDVIGTSIETVVTGNSYRLYKLQVRNRRRTHGCVVLIALSGEVTGGGIHAQARRASACIHPPLTESDTECYQ